MLSCPEKLLSPDGPGLGACGWILVPATPKSERLWLEDPTHQPLVLLAPELQSRENPPEVGELWLGCCVSRYSPQFPELIHTRISGKELGRKGRKKAGMASQGWKPR